MERSTKTKANLRDIVGSGINPSTEDKQNKIINDALTNKDILLEILSCQKKIIKHLELLTEVEFKDHNVAK